MCELNNIKCILIENWQQILSDCEFLGQIRLRLVCKQFYNRLEIHNFFYIDSKYLNILDDKIISNYSFIMQLNASFNQKITNLSHLTKLRKLDASGTKSTINQDSITTLNLIELNVDFNKNIKNLNHMTSLQKLKASCNSGIDDNGIKKLNLVELDASSNNKITNINHMTSLQKLVADFSCGIDNEGIKNLNIIELYAIENHKINIKM